MRLFIIILTLLSLTSCSIKNKNKVEQVIVNEPPYKLRGLTDKLKKYCQIKKIKLQKEYLHLVIDSDKNFYKKSTLLTKDTKENLECLISFIKEEKDTIIEVLAYSDEKKKKKAQNISDNRAITVSELLFNKGIRSEIYAKGCTKELSNNIDIYIYPNKENMINQCTKE
jgi:outer membrane protein OmpA-like peptidoglycan-associated protein